MKRNRVLLFAAIILCQLGIAQTFNYKWGPENNMPDLKNPRVQVHPGENGEYFVSYVTVKGFDLTYVNLDKFSSGGELISSENLFPKWNLGGADHRAFFKAGNGFLYFIARYIHDEKKYKLMVMKIGADGDIEGEPQELVAFDEPKARNAGLFFVTPSPDYQKFVVAYEFDTEKEQPQKLGLEVFNANLESQQKTVYTFDKPKEKNWFNEYYLNNNGELFIFNRSRPKKQDMTHNFYAFSQQLEMVSMNTIELEEKQKIVDDKRMITIDPASGKLVYTCFYSEDGNVVLGGSNYHGLLYFTTGADAGGNKIQKINRFEKSIKESAKVKYLLTDGGNAYFVVTDEGETKKDVSPAGHTGFPVYSITNYLYKIMVYGFDADGTLKWTYLKEGLNQKSTDDGGEGISVFATVENGNVLLVYNDFEYAHDGKSHPVVAGALATSLIPVTISIDKFGRGVEAPIFNSGTGERKYAQDLVPAFFTRLGDGTYAVYARGSKFKTGIFNVAW